MDLSASAVLDIQKQLPSDAAIAPMIQEQVRTNTMQELQTLFPDLATTDITSEMNKHPLNKQTVHHCIPQLYQLQKKRDEENRAALIQHQMQKQEVDNFLSIFQSLDEALVKRVLQQHKGDFDEASAELAARVEQQEQRQRLQERRIADGLGRFKVKTYKKKRNKLEPQSSSVVAVSNRSGQKQEAKRHSTVSSRDLVPAQPSEQIILGLLSSFPSFQRSDIVSVWQENGGELTLTIDMLISRSTETKRAELHDIQTRARSNRKAAEAAKPKDVDDSKQQGVYKDDDGDDDFIIVSDDTDGSWLKVEAADVERALMEELEKSKARARAEFRSKLNECLRARYQVEEEKGGFLPMTAVCIHADELGSSSKYRTTGSVRITWSDLPSKETANGAEKGTQVNRSRDWVGISAIVLSSTGDDPIVKWRWTKGALSGSLVLDGITPGRYIAHLHTLDSPKSTLLTRAYKKIALSGHVNVSPTYALDAYAESGTGNVVVSVRESYCAPDAWVSITPESEKHNEPKKWHWLRDSEVLKDGSRRLKFQGLQHEQKPCHYQVAVFPARDMGKWSIANASAVTSVYIPAPHVCR